MRIHVIGNSGAGKTTLAGQIANRLHCPHVELDALHWGPNWQLPTIEQFRADVTNALAGDEWVADGNYSKARDIIWARVDWVIWLDYPLALIVWRLLRRSIWRIVTREELWEARNRETFHAHFVDPDALIPYAIKSHHRRRHKFQVLIQEPDYAHIRFIRLRSSAETERWLKSFNPHADKRQQ